MTATILGTLPAGSPPNPGKSDVTIQEIQSDGTALSPNTVTITAPENTFTFTAAIGSTLKLTQVDTKVGGLPSNAVPTPDYVVENPMTADPAGGIALTVVSVN